MLVEDFKRIVTAFADRDADIDITRGTLLVQIREELIEAHLFQREGSLIVEESGEQFSAASWLINRVAKISVLADRILTYTAMPENFVVPSGQLLDQPDFSESSEPAPQTDAVQCASSVLGRRSAGTASVLYLTSDAGEGKTTLINYMAHSQASEYKAKRTDWLLVPIPLGGRTFLRFDDVVIGALVNKLRFQLLYYDAFLELVRLGVLIPAFDGFEEMIIEASPGEAISALGNLVSNLHSAGSILVAARKAYFDYRSFRTQARLFDAVGSDNAAFARLSLNRWDQPHFVAYGTKRGFPDPQGLYDAVAERLSPQHPLLTRAVLVRRLVDVAERHTGLAEVLDEVGHQPQDYFFQFVNALVDREAREKWLDQSGEPSQPLLAVEEHHELLSMVAQEIWLSSVEGLRSDVVGVIADLFAEAKSKSPAVARQIRERLKQHSLLVTTTGGTLAFDHEDFHVFYLGEALGSCLERGDSGETRALLQVTTLPRASVDEAVQYLRRRSSDMVPVLRRLQELAIAELPTSFVRENCGALALAILDGTPIGAVRLSAMSFPAESLRGRRLSDLTIADSYFQPTTLASCTLQDCEFVNTRFERLELSPTAVIAVTLNDCDVGSLFRPDQDDQLFDPSLILGVLPNYGFTVRAHAPQLARESIEPDEELRLIERVLRTFLRSTEVNESFIRTRLGVKANQFLNEVLPDLLGATVLKEVPYLGSGANRRFKLGARMHRIQDALSRCGGDYREFLHLCATQDAR